VINITQEEKVEEIFLNWESSLWNDFINLISKIILKFY
jgi:hypothetical protein